MTRGSARTSSPNATSTSGGRTPGSRIPPFWTSTSRLLFSEDAEALDDSAYPKTWLHKGFELPLSYEFHPVAPGSTPNPSDGVTAEVPVLFLNQLDDAPFRWQIPGQRVELVTALIKSLPKQIRKNFVPAPDVARQAVAALEADFDPAEDELEASLELVLRRLKGPHRPARILELGCGAAAPACEFQGSGRPGQGAGRGQGPRRAAGASWPLPPAAPSPSPWAPPPADRQAPRSTGTRRLPAGVPEPAAGRAGRAAAGTRGFTEQSGLAEWRFGTLQREVSVTVKGHTVTGFPALVDEGKTVGLRVFQTPSEQQDAMRGGVIRLLALRVPAPDRYVLEHLNNTEKLTFSQNPHGSVSALIADCVLAAVDKLTPAELPWDQAAFDALYEHVRAELIDTVFSVTAVVERILASTRRIEKQLKGTSSLALISALNDVRSQLDSWSFPALWPGRVRTAEPGAPLPDRH